MLLSHNRGSTSPSHFFPELFLIQFSLEFEANRNQGDDAKLSTFSLASYTKPFLCAFVFTSFSRGLLNEYQLSLGSKMYLSNALSMLNRNLTRFVQSLFSVQSKCTVRKGSACRVKNTLREITNDAFEESDKSYFRVCRRATAFPGFS